MPVLIMQAVLVSVEIVDQRFSSGAAHNVLQQSPPVFLCLLSPTLPVAWDMKGLSVCLSLFIYLFVKAGGLGCLRC